MTLREWITKPSSGMILIYDVYRMADKLGIDMREDRSFCDIMKLHQFEKQINNKCNLVISMFERRFGLDEEF